MFLQTKFTPIDGQDISNMPYSKNDEIEVQVEKSFETSKENLQTSFIDSGSVKYQSFFVKSWSLISDVALGLDINGFSLPSFTFALF